MSIPIPKRYPTLTLTLNLILTLILTLALALSLIPILILTLSLTIYLYVVFLKVLTDYTSLLQSRGKFREAYPLMTSQLEGLERVKGERDPDVINLTGMS